MNWNRPNNGYEREPWQKAWQPIEKIRQTSKAFWNEPVPKFIPSPFAIKVRQKINKSGYVMTDEIRAKIQALRKK